MPVVTLARPGQPCLAAVRDALAEVRGGDPLAPATLVVPGPLARLHVRRALGRLGGLAAVEVATLDELAERLAGPARLAAGTRPLPPGGWGEAVRVALAADPGPFRPVAHHPGSIVKVAAALRRLQPATAAERAALASRPGAGRRAQHLVGLLEAVEASIGAHHDARPAALAACAALDGGVDPGPVVAFCPRGVDPGEADLLARVAAAGRLRVVVATTGDAAADAPVRSLVERLDGPAAGAGASGAEGHAAPVPDHLVLAPDAEAEGRLVVQQVVAALEAGVAGHDIAVATFGGATSVARLGDLLDAAGVAWTGPVGHSLACTPSGRALLGLLGLDGEGWTHAGVLATLGSAPLRRGPGRGGPLPLGRWAALARQANVVAGADQWHERPVLAAARARAVGNDAVAAELDDLAGFAAGLARLLTPPAERSWTALAEWALGVLDHVLEPVGPGEGAVPGPGASAWPPAEVAAHAAVRATVAGLAHLDTVVAGAAARPGPPELVAALEAALAAKPAPRRGRVGRGVLLTGAVGELAGATPTLLVLSGVVEGAAPARRADDPLVPDEEIGLVHASPSRAARRAAERADVLAAIGSAGRTVAFAHRADAQSARRPSRWFLGWAGALSGRGSALGADDLEHAEGPWLTVVPSFTAAACGSLAGSRQERRLAALGAEMAGGRSTLALSPIVAADPVLARAVTASAARRSDRFTPWDGLLGRRLELDEEVSATALEEWSTCPQRYLLHRVLGVAETAATGDALDVDGRERGSLAHQVLAAVVRRGVGRPPEQPWGEDDRTFLRDELRRRADRLRRSGRLGTGVLADLRIDELQAALLAALDHDDAVRAEEGWVPAAVEEAFGEEAGRPVVVGLPSGRAVRFRGRIDRVDRGSGDDRRVRVVDYKTGRGKQYLEAATGAAAAGRLLQLAVYEAAARAAEPAAEVSSGWWLLEAATRDGRSIVPNSLDAGAFRAAVAAILDGIEAGAFPADPGEDGYRGPENCRFCPYDRVCRVDRVRALQRVADDPALARWRALRAVGETVAGADDVARDRGAS